MGPRKSTLATFAGRVVTSHSIKRRRAPRVPEDVNWIPAASASRTASSSATKRSSVQSETSAGLSERPHAELIPHEHWALVTQRTETLHVVARETGAAMDHQQRRSWPVPKATPDDAAARYGDSTLRGPTRRIGRACAEESRCCACNDRAARKRQCVGCVTDGAGAAVHLAALRRRRRVPRLR